MLQHTALLQLCFCAASCNDVLLARVYAFRVWLVTRMTPAFDDFRVSSRLAQSESVKCRQSFDHSCITCKEYISSYRKSLQKWLRKTI